MNPLIRSVLFSMVFIIALLFTIVNASAADLNADTLKIWTQFVESQEKRMSAELSSQKGFLYLDFLNPKAAAEERRDLFAGNISTQPMGSGEIRIQGGMIHHWRGSLFVPGMNLDFILARVQHPELETSRQEDVLDSRVLERSPNSMKIYLKLQRSKIVTAVYNTEHIVQFYRYGNDKASSRSVSTKIAELERVRDKVEQEKPEGQDRGFLWKMNSYWRYQQVTGGVIIECESITLSRSIPSWLDALIRPIIKDIAQESLQRTLQSLRVRLEQAHKKDMTSRSLSNKTESSLMEERLISTYRSKAALSVTGSIRVKATKAPMATAMSSVAMIA
jgi:hypothetical protein